MSLKAKVLVNTHYTRSINLERDYSSLDVVRSYIPTSRALKLFGRVSDCFHNQQAPRAWSLIGPYGSGKSSASVFLSQLVANPETESAVLAISKLKDAAPDIAESFQRDTTGSKGYLTVLITGSPEPMGKRITQALADSAEAFFAAFKGRKPDTINSLKELAQSEHIKTSELIQHIQKLQLDLAKKECRGIHLFIDELGKFLEFEARHYGVNDIYMLQALAELACEGNDCNFFVFVLLHQSFEQYAKGLGESLKNEWSKVQGRFEDVPFLESAEQTLRVVSAAFSHQFTPDESRELKNNICNIVDTLHEQNAVPGVMDRVSATDLMYDCYPLHPVSAILLPALCQKVAQNERTLFSYLGSHEEYGLQDMLVKLQTIEDMVYPHHIFDYFIANQPAALSDYRTHRRWAEVVTAVDRLGDASDEELNLLKTIGLLNIIGSKAGFRPSSSLLETCAAKRISVNDLLASLSDKSVITYRKFSDEYRVWQGSDFDLEDAIEDELSKLGQFSLSKELNNADALMPVVARRYTIKSGALRYFSPEFIDASSYEKSPTSTNEPRVLFFLASGKDDESAFHEKAVSYFSDLDIVGLCLNGTQLREAVSEVLALKQIQKNRQELNNDPVAKREFEDRLSAAIQAEGQLLKELLDNPQESCWFYHGKEIKVTNKRHFQERLSQILERVYCKSPVLHNELINRDRPSSQAVAARNKLLEAMIANPKDLDDLGIEKFPPEKAIYRSVLRQTGLHNPETREFQIPGPESNFYAVWREIDLFLDSTEAVPKSFTELNNTLMAPPYGVKAGVLPILYIAAYIIYQHELALYEQKSYKPVMTGGMLDRFVKRPDEYTFQRFRISGLRSSIYAEYCKLIDVKNNHSVIQLVKPLAQFIDELPEYTRKTKSSELSNKAKKVRNAFDFSKSPDHLIFEDLPKALGYEKEIKSDVPNLEGLAQSLQGCLKELKDAYPIMLKQHISMLISAFHMGPDNNLASLRAKIIGRFDGLDEYTVDVDGIKAFIKRLTKQQGNDDEWLENILMFLGQKPSSKWTDANRAEVDIKLSDFAKRILDLETLKLHYDSSHSDMDGEFDIILIKSLKKGCEPVDEVVSIDSQKRDAIREYKNEIYEAIRKHSDSELQLAALAEIVDEFLTERRGSISGKNIQVSNMIKEVKNG